MPEFTQYIKQATDWPPELVKAVANVLRAEMKKRGLWTAPPNWLGYDGNSWNEEKYSKAFEGLLYDCYMTAIIKRLPRLQIRIEQAQDINNIVYQNIKNFITDQQKKHDPIGYYVAHNAKQAIQCAIDNGIIKVASGLNHKGKVHNPTLLFYSSQTTASEQEQIVKVLRNNSTWMEIRQKLAGKSEKVHERLCDIICQLQNSGINCFRFKSLVDAMKEDVREESKYHFAKEMALEIQQTTRNEFEEDEAEFGEKVQEIVQFIQPDNSAEEQESYCDFCNKLRDAIDNSSFQERVRERLHQELIEFEDAIETEKAMPSQTELSKRLNVAISTINDDIMKRLQQLVKQVKSKDLE